MEPRQLDRNALPLPEVEEIWHWDDLDTSLRQQFLDAAKHRVRRFSLQTETD